MLEKWEGNEGEEFVTKIKELCDDIKVPTISSVLAEIKKFDVEVPSDYNDGMDIAMEVLAGIQKYRDIVIALKIVMIEKRNGLYRLWNFAKSSSLIRDSDIDAINTVNKKEAAIKLTYDDLYIKHQLANENVECIIDLVENAIAKFNVVSRQITLMELQIRLGEAERKRSKNWGGSS